MRLVSVRDPSREDGPRASGRLPGLDALRGIAALAVLAFHTLAIFGAGPALTGKGYLAVDFFFMLSGYVMARTYEQRMGSGLGVWRFMWARYRRLWPVMAIGALLGASLLLPSADAAGFAWITFANLLLIPVFTGSLIFPLNGSAWSVLFELVANFIHGALLWRLRARMLLVLAAAMGAAMAWAVLQYGSFDIGARPRNALGGLPRALLSYVVGIVLWRWWRDRPSLALPSALAFLAMPVFLLAVSLFGLGSALLDFGFVLVLCPLLIAGGLAYAGEHWAGHWSGSISFPLYAVHMPLLNGAKTLGLGAAAGVAAALFTAAAMAHWMDRPAGCGMKTA